MDLRSWLHNAFEIGRHSLQPKGLNITRDGALVREDLLLPQCGRRAFPASCCAQGTPKLPVPQSSTFTHMAAVTRLARPG